MKTSSIALRVADFLMQYPPFQFMTEDELLKLVDSGRVKFHESEEHIFQEGEPRGPHFYVVQQGTVHIFKNT